MASDPNPTVPGDDDLECLGVVVHPSRDIGAPLHGLRRWAVGHGVSVVQLHVAGQNREVAPLGHPEDCDLIVSIGGDGTMLAAVRAAASADRPVLGVACGSLGALTATPAGALEDSLNRFSRGDWIPTRLPALTVGRPDGLDLLALNDIAVLRGGIGQVRVTARVDGVLFSRLAGDGCVISTPVGSSAYGLAAGGPLLTPEAEAFVLTPLPTHGGFRPPLVLGARAQLELEVATGYGGSRLEVDGQLAATELQTLTVSFRPAVATVVSFPGQESLFAGLRRRQIIIDSPRILAEDPTE
jgi:NAD+ kinase